MTNPPRGFPIEVCRELDRRAIALGIPGSLLMEHASLGATRLALEVLGARSEPPRIWILCGPGNNGGDGCAMARHLYNAGARPVIWSLVDPRDLPPDGDAALQYRILTAMGIAVTPAHTLLPPVPTPPPDLIVDAIFGTGLGRAPAGRFADAIEQINSCPAPVLAVDTPSGLDSDAGEPLGATVEARWTATFGLPKKGFLAPAAQRFTGAVFYVPIGVPRDLLPAGFAAYPPEPRRISGE